MLSRLLDRLVSPALSAPSIWGKIPAYGDFAQCDAHAEDIESWQLWFAAHPLQEIAENATFRIESAKRDPAPTPWFRVDIPDRRPRVPEGPWGFLLPPRALRPAPHLPSHACIAGAMALSCDKVGRLHPIVVWSALREDRIEQMAEPFNWVYWASRLLRSHTPPVSTPAAPNVAMPMLDQLAALWQEARPTFGARLAVLRQPLPAAALSALADIGGGEPTDDSGGVRRLPWEHWPRCIRPEENGGRRSAFFWQQATSGEFLACAAIPLDGSAS